MKTLLQDFDKNKARNLEMVVKLLSCFGIRIVNNVNISWLISSVFILGTHSGFLPE